MPLLETKPKIKIPVARIVIVSHANPQIVEIAIFAVHLLVGGPGSGNEIGAATQ